ncbi:MAG: hypothetical protein KDH20_08740 [Rhodocyclaceae bacterium]|nr:hypothetical protein [Rhodocyclaceae bacterium]
MTEPEIMPADRPTRAAPDGGLVNLTHVIYGLHALAVVIGVASGAATVLGSFVGGLPSIIAVILNYVKRSDVRGTWLDSHFSWQIRTFWYAAVWIVAFYILFFTLIGIPLAFVAGIGATLWVIYRVARGWLALNKGEPMPY